MRRGGEGIEVAPGVLIALGVATLVTSVIVFLLGIYVGKGIAEDRLGEVPRIPPVVMAHATPTVKVEIPFPAPTRDPVVVAPRATSAPQLAAPTKVPTQAPAPPTRKPPPTAKPKPTRQAPAGYRVQVSATSDRNRAEGMVKKLRDGGFTAEISKTTVKGRALFRVRVGAYTSEESARKAVQQFRRQGYPRAFLVAE